VANTINIYWAHDIPGLCGQSSFPGDSTQGIVLTSTCLQATQAHELGHYFNLYHTHETVLGVECPSQVQLHDGGRPSVRYGGIAPARSPRHVERLHPTWVPRWACLQLYNQPRPDQHHELRRLVQKHLLSRTA